jgi:acyl-CoA hydrolase
MKTLSITATNDTSTLTASATGTPLKLLQPVETIHSFDVFPEDMNYTGSLFGGKILAEMDKTAAKAARRILYGTECDSAVTVSLDKVDFISPAHLGDFIELRAHITRLGNTSIQIHVFVSKENIMGHIEKICEGVFVFVALKNGKPHPHGRCLMPSLY